MSIATTAMGLDSPRTLHRSIDWKDAVWIAMGVPAVVLFSVGAIAATVGTPSWAVWTISVMFGFVQAFTYAEIAGLFPNKSGGASVYGAAAWLRYGKLIAPVSVWTNWLAWSPVLAIGSGLAASAILRVLVPADAALMAWQVTLLDLGAIKEGLTVRINAPFFVGLLIMLAVFAIQHHGILRTAKVQTIASVAVLIPLLIVGVVPLLNGAVDFANFSPFVPIGHAANCRAAARGGTHADEPHAGGG